MTVEALDAEGAAADSVTYADRYLNAWISLPSAAGYRIAGVSPTDELRINRVQVFAGGAVPDGAALPGKSRKASTFAHKHTRK